MGIGSDSFRFMLYAASKGVSYERTLTLGRQNCFMSQSQIDGILGEYDSAYTKAQALKLKEGLDATEPPFSEPLFRYLGASAVDSMDYSDYEGATVLHDLNIPVPDDLKNKYSCVFDGGLLEHVFNYPASIRNCMDMVRVGGWLLLATPGNNWFGHGFYQFSPELFFSLLSEQNGYTDTRVFLYCQEWCECANPRKIKRRTEMSSINSLNPTSMELYVMSKKTGDTPDRLTVTQSDYEIAWEERDSSHHWNKASQLQETSSLLRIYLSLPMFIRPLAKKIHRVVRRDPNYDYAKFTAQRQKKEFLIPCPDFEHPRKQ
ncbi:hypothetical protein FACS1894167_13930 [Synergistales bacterium]|nr:hypothetical protein FACS1894167_13930 [Synergistales bacterium]